MRVPQRGRAILQRLSPHDSVRAFRPGDFVLTRSNAGLARLLGWATGGQLNHAALIVDPVGTVIEANPSFLSDARAFRMSTIAEYVQTGKPCWIGYVELREGSRQDVVAYAEHLLHAYGITGIGGRLWLALHTLMSVAPRSFTGRYALLRPVHQFFDQHALVVREEHCFSSGEFVARALERGGFIWDRDPAHVTPDDLFQRYHLVDDPIALKPTPLRFKRRQVSASASPKNGGQAPITQLALRGVRGATALKEQPFDDESLSTGMRALVQVGLWTAAGLAVAGMIEEVLRSIGMEA